MKFNPDNHNPDPAYLRGLIEKIGLSQRKIAALLGIDERTFRMYLANRTAKNILDCPYTVQFCLESIATKNMAEAIMLQNLWLKAAKLENIPQSEMYCLKKIPSYEHYWVDGVCGYQVASGDTAEIAIQKAIEKIQKYKEEKAAGKTFCFSPCFD